MVIRSDIVINRVADGYRARPLEGYGKLVGSNTCVWVSHAPWGTSGLRGIAAEMLYLQFDTQAARESVTIQLATNVIMRLPASYYTFTR